MNSRRRFNRDKKIKKRFRLASALNRFLDKESLKPSYFDNNNEMNKYGQRGKAKKTKAKHGHASYRHKGAYGKAISYSSHDQRRIDSMKDQELEDLYGI